MRRNLEPPFDAAPEVPADLEARLIEPATQTPALTVNVYAEGYSAAAGGLRLALAPLLVAAGALAWVRFRDEAKAWLRRSQEESRALRTGTAGTGR